MSSCNYKHRKMVDHRLARWERKLATLTPDTPEYKKHLKTKPKPATGALKRKAGKSTCRTTRWGTFKLTPQPKTAVPFSQQASESV